MKSNVVEVKYFNKGRESLIFRNNIKYKTQFIIFTYWSDLYGNDDTIRKIAHNLFNEKTLWEYDVIIYI